jgi:cytochrome P450
MTAADSLASVPRFDGDLYAAAALRDASPFHRTLRDLGPAVWMPKRQLWAISRYDDVRAALKADTTLVSSRGVAANDIVNRGGVPTTLTSDGDVHMRRRQTLAQPLGAASLKAMRAHLEAEADELAARLANGGEFDAVSSFAAHLPVTVVAELVGLDDNGRANILRWAAATFNALGPMNTRGLGALPQLLELGRYSATLDRTRVKPGGWAEKLFDAADAGAISREEANAMVIDYVAPALDTTILATAHMVWLLSTTPGAYDQLREQPELIPSVVNETLRFASPIRGFTRHAADNYHVSGTVIPKGSRALILFASANRDERHYENPDAFDVTRNPRDHVGWGHGPHTCAGMHLARLEMEILLAALLRRVSGIKVGKPELLKNNVLQGFKALPAQFDPA